MCWSCKHAKITHRICIWSVEPVLKYISSTLTSADSFYSNKRFCYQTREYSNSSQKCRKESILMLIKLGKSCYHLFITIPIARYENFDGLKLFSLIFDQTHWFWWFVSHKKINLLDMLLANSAKWRQIDRTKTSKIFEPNNLENNMSYHCKIA